MKMNRLRWLICIVVFIAGLLAISKGLSPESDPVPGFAADIQTTPVSVAWFSLDDEARKLLREADSGPDSRLPLVDEFQRPVPPAAAKPEPSVIPPTQQPVDSSAVLTSWVVRPGDSMWKIAKEALGDANRMSEIIALNPTIPPERLRVGQIVQLPASVQAHSVEKPEEMAFHTVEDGETLFSIARLHYGIDDWTPIRAANRDQLSNPDHLRVGMRLKIPPRGADGGGQDR